jgi:uncharacterized protein involved in propanediol utilization
MGALGINVAHTGTMVGLLFSSGEAGEALSNKAGRVVQNLVGSGCIVKSTQIEGDRAW